MAGEEGIRLGDAALKIGSGATPKGGKEVYLASGDIALIRSQNVYNDHFSKDGLAWILPEHAEQLSNVEVQEDDILLNITGDSVARCCQVPNEILPARVNQHVAIIRPEPSKINPRFLRYFLISPTMQGHMLGLAASGATRNALTKGMIENFIIPPFSTTEQKAIADVLSALDDKIELNRRMNETLEGIARTLFKDWFIDFGPVKAKAAGQVPPGLDEDIAALFPDALDEAGVPVGWLAGTLFDIALLNPEAWTKSTRPDEINYVDLANTKWGTIEAIQKYKKEGAPSRAQRVLKYGDTIVGVVRPGNGSYCYVGLDGLTGSTGFAALRPKEHHYREVTYLAATSAENIERLAHLADGAAYPAVKPEVVASTEIRIPDDEIFKAFSTVTSGLLDLIEANKKESNILAILRDTLLPKLISGEIRVQDVENQLEEVS